MKFLNKKEQVIDLEITPYGKSLLARGSFKPEFYAFYDDAILYDSQHVGFVEHQNSASVRIKEMPQLETQAFFYSAEDQVKTAVKFHRLSEQEKQTARDYGEEPMDIDGTPYVADDGVTIGTIADREFSGIPIGTSDLNSSNAAAWKINFLKGTISGSNAYWNAGLTGSGGVQRIPQLDMDDITYRLELSDTIKTDNFYELSGTSDPSGDFLNVYEDSIVLEIEEDNTNFDWENFEIEVYEVETHEFSAGGTLKRYKDFIKPLFFKKQMSEVQNNILVDPDKLQEENTALDSSYVEYYFDILVDKEIDELCELNPSDKAEGIFSSRMLECEDTSKKKINLDNLYDTIEEDFTGSCQ